MIIKANKFVKEVIKNYYCRREVNNKIILMLLIF